jgi:hypothetical protein
MLAFRVIAVQQSIDFEVSDDRFDGIAALDGALESPGIHAAFLTGFIDCHACHFDAPITQIHNDFFSTCTA